MKKLILALGSNLGNRKKNLEDALDNLNEFFEVTATSRVYASDAVDYLDQPEFLNQVVECELPELPPEGVLQICNEIEKFMGRRRDIPKGPRIIDIDILFYGEECIDEPDLVIPHPSIWERSFVVLPLMELPTSVFLHQKFVIPQKFDNSAHPL